MVSSYTNEIDTHTHTSHNAHRVEYTTFVTNTYRDRRNVAFKSNTKTQLINWLLRRV